MKINKVELENFRIHEKAEFNFSDGINLLLGENGTGKSSVLEAVGIALFNVKGRSDFKTAIKFSKKFAKIKVEFTGNDGINYIIEKGLGTRPQHILYPASNISEKLTYNDNNDTFFTKIKELTGIPHNSKIDTIYKNVITAYQNEIVDAFLKKDQERQNLFNSIFNTEIYRKLSTDFFKKIMEEYSVISKELTKDIENKEILITPQDLLNKDITDILFKIQSENERMNKLEKEINELCEKEKNLEDKRNLIDKNNAEITHINLAIEKAQKNILDLNNELLIALKSLDIINSNATSYKNYLSIQEELNKLKPLITQKEQYAQQIRQIETKLQKNIEYIKVDETKISGKTDNLNEKRITLAERNNELNELQAFIKKNQEDVANLQNYILKINTLKNRFEKIEENQIKLNNEYDKTKTASTTLECELLPSEDNLINELKLLDKNLEITEEKRKELENLKTKFTANKESLKILNESEKMLIKGNCPHLNEECLNLKGKGSPDAYFIEKKNTIKASIFQLSEQIMLLKNIEKQKEEILQKITENKHKIGKNCDIRNKIEINKKAIELIEEKIRNSNLELELLENDVKKLIDTEKDFKTAISEVLNETNSRITEMKTILESSNKTFNETIILKKKLESEIIELEDFIKNSSLKIDDLLKASTDLESRKDELSKNAQGLDELKAEYEEKTLKKNDLQADYEKYMKNKATADNAGNYELKIKKENNELEDLNNKKNKMQLQLTDLNKGFSLDEYEKTRGIIKIKEEEKLSSTRNLGVFESQKETLLKDIERNEKIIKDIDIAKITLNLIKKKIELTDIFRENINIMGKHISEILMKKVEILATENFRRLTGRSEKIVWENIEKDSYMVSLSGKKQNEEIKTSFQDLSGGEQVVVALSMRYAITSLLTKSNFAVFDEPTINLDAQKRESLAVYLKEMLKNLNQAIIVTHDGNFEEMAKTVIKL